jgi:hypothetical protein
MEDEKIKLEEIETSHHKDRATVHGRVEAEDSKGSTWISKDAR